MNLLIAAQSGWGKSHTAQEKIEKNLPRVDYAVICDLKDEYRGLLRPEGPCYWAIAGPKEVQWGPTRWRDYLLRHKKIVVAPYQLTSEEWQHVVAKIAKALRLIHSMPGNNRVLIAIDEAHFVATEGEKYPKPIKRIATTGRGENMSSIWVTQRLAELHKTVTAECNAVYAGGFTDRNDLDAIPTSGYDRDLHNPMAGELNTNHVPEQLRIEGRAIPLRKWLSSDDHFQGSEWVYADETGRLERHDRRNVDMRTTHYGQSGFRLRM